MMPVPSHLVGIVIPKDLKIDEGQLDAWIRCPCGEDQFAFCYPGATREYEGKRYPCTADVGGFFFFLICCRCVSCEQEHLLLDKDFHGWNGWICHDAQQAARPRPSLIVWRCEFCGGELHRGSVQVYSEGKADFVQYAANIGFPLERWPDGFGGFNVCIECVGCGTVSEPWVVCETM